MNIRLEKADRVLIVAPHPDDESIGAGGFIALHPEAIDVLILTDGRKGHPKEFSIEEQELCEIRKKECKEALSMVGVKGIYFEDIVDGTVIRRKAIHAIKSFANYKYIFVPNRKDNHIDHRATYRLIRKLTKKNSKKLHSTPVLVEYEVWTPLQNPNCFVDISQKIDSKKKMIQVYKSQLLTCNYIEMSSGLNQYRAGPRQMKYAEAFRVALQPTWRTVVRALLPVHIIDWARTLIYK